MYKNKSIAVVVPAYNEELLIVRTIESIPDFVDTIVVVNDCSKDQTSQAVIKYQQSNEKNVVLLEHKKNQGVGGAIATGYEWCRDNDIDAAAVMAGDAQMDPNDLPNLLDPVVNDEVDYAKGNRLMSGEAWNKIPRIRYLGNSGLSLLTKIASGYWHVADSQTGYTVINKKALHTIKWDEMYKRYGMPNDLLVRLNVYNFRVRDVIIEPIYGVGEKSGIRPIIMIPKLAWLLFRLFIWRMLQKYIIRDFHPLIFFYFTAALLFMALFPLSWRIIYRVFVLGSEIPPFSALAFVFCAISGLQTSFFAMWFDMESNKHLR